MEPVKTIRDIETIKVIADERRLALLRPISAISSSAEITRSAWSSSRSW